MPNSSGISEIPTTELTAAAPATGRATFDQVPWPLPVGQTLLGRYQIVSLEESQPLTAHSQNVYHVTDLQGYLHCWSCDADYGQATASERFCPNCGADMLGHEYLMTERRDLQGDESRARSIKFSGARKIATFTVGERAYVVTTIVPEERLFPDGPHISAAGKSHVGLTRAGDTNEDCFGALVVNLAQDSRVAPLAIGVVADGLGGHANGQEASRLASRTFVEHLTRGFVQPFLLPMGSVAPSSEAIDSALREAVAAANTAVYEANVQGMGDMGSTLVATLIVGDDAWIANLGDSRAYVLDGDGLRRISIDHSLVEQLIVSGMITPEERYTHSQRNRIFRSLGSDPSVDVDIFTQKLTPGMQILLCSDGMWEMTRDPEMETILLQNHDLRAACDALISSANKNGGEDNITIVLLRADA
jgi:serine/threonine protein phosphatase PrpC